MTLSSAQARERFAAARVARLATADADGLPNVRMVLLKGVDTGFVFYSNAQSGKGGELAANARAALNFHWKSLRKAVRLRPQP